MAPGTPRARIQGVVFVYDPIYRPAEHEPWCTDHGYESCSCDLEARQLAWDSNYRATNAMDLPVVSTVRRSWTRSRLRKLFDFR